MALHSLYCADVPLRNCSLTHSSYSSDVLISQYGLFILCYLSFGSLILIDTRQCWKSSIANESLTMFHSQYCLFDCFL